MLVLGQGARRLLIILSHFGGGHIPQSFPMVGGWNPPSSTPNPSYNFQGWNGQMGGVSTSYISSVYPSSTMHFPMNDFLMENPPLTYGITSGGINFPWETPSHGVPSSRGNVYPHMGNLSYCIFFLASIPILAMRIWRTWVWVMGPSLFYG
jgi:hypothetical protein